MKKTKLFMAVLLAVLALSASAQDREDTSPATLSAKSLPITKATYWSKDTKTGRWESRKNTSRPYEGEGVHVDNFNSIFIGEYAGHSYLFLDYYQGAWRYPNLQLEWMYYRYMYMGLLSEEDLSTLKKAYEDHLMLRNPLRDIGCFKKEEGTRMYLTVEELRRLAVTPCDHESVRRAFLFSCLTGLRRSDILQLTWAEVYQQGAFTRLIFTQKKTHGLEYLDLTPQAVALMGERGRPEDPVFDDFFAPGSTNEVLRRWVLRAGIDKKITFHCGRHTFAVMMLDLGADLYTVSKLLGHRDIATTQIYAKVLDKNKQAAVSLIPDILR